MKFSYAKELRCDDGTCSVDWPAKPVWSVFGLVLIYRRHKMQNSAAEQARTVNERSGL